MKFRPTGNYVIIRTETETMTASGLHLPAWRQNESEMQGIVEAVGPEITTVSVGEQVMFRGQGSAKISPDHRAVTLDHVICVVEEK